MLCCIITGMAQHTPRANLTLPGGGSSGTITPDEPADIDVLNENFRKIDAMLGATPVPTASAIPANSMDGQLFWVVDAQELRAYDSNAGTGVVTGNRMPAGVIMIFAGSVAPPGWELCRGQNLSRTLNAELFAAIGSTYGNGDGTSTFGLPDLRGRVPVGFNSSETEFNALNKKGGAKTHTLTEAQMPAHNHSLSNHRHRILGGNNGSTRLYSAGAEPASSASSKWHPWFGSGWNALDNVYTDYQSGTIGNKGGGQAHPNLQPYITLNYIISTGK